MKNRNNFVSIIILNWNGFEDTKKCLLSVMKNNYKYFNVLVIDNGSRQNEAHKLKNVFKNKIDVYRSFKNLGFSAGVNLGIQQMKKKYNPDYYLLLNNDTEVEPSFLSELVKNASGREIGMASPAILSFHERSKFWFAGGRINWPLAKPQHLYWLDDNNKYQEFLTGCSLLIKRQVTEKVGFLDERFFAYFEDAAYSLKVRDAGFKCKLIPSSKIYHIHAASTGVESSFKTYLMSRNRILFAKNYAPKLLWPYYYIFFTAKFLLAVIYFTFNGKYERRYAYTKGYYDGMKNLGGEPSL